MVAFTIFIASCGAKEEKKIDTDKDKEANTVVDETNPDYDIYNNESDTIDEEITDTVSDVEEIPEEEEVKEPVNVENEDGTTSKVSEEELAKETKKKHVKKFYIIAGSFKDMKNAVNFKEFFKKKGHPAMVLYPFHSFNRVATGTYTTLKGSRKDIKKFRDLNLKCNGEKVEYWLLWR